MEKHTLRPCPFCGNPGEITQLLDTRSVGKSKDRKIAEQMLSETKAKGLYAQMYFRDRVKTWYVWKQIIAYKPRCSYKSCLARQTHKRFTNIDDAITAWNAGCE